MFARCNVEKREMEWSFWATVSTSAKVVVRHTRLEVGIGHDQHELLIG